MLGDFEFTKILLLSETYLRPIGDIDMPHRRQTYPIGNQHAPSETDMPVETYRRPTCLRSSTFKYTYFDILFCLFILEQCKYSNQACISPMCLRLGMSASDVCPIKHVELSDWSLIRHVGLRWVSDQSCLSPMGL